MWDLKKKSLDLNLVNIICNLYDTEQCLDILMSCFPDIKWGV